jgi:hypothetical protein
VTAAHHALAREIEAQTGRELDPDERREVGRIAWRLVVQESRVGYEGRHRRPVGTA